MNNWSLTALLYSPYTGAILKQVTKSSHLAQIFPLTCEVQVHMAHRVFTSVTDYWIKSGVSDYIQMDVLTSAKSAQYIKILGQGRKQTSRIHRVTS